jgi:predicted nuclease of predicted toxin-antitoxin system
LLVGEDRVVVSKDEDFVFLANRAGDQGRLIWVRLGNCRNLTLLEAFDRLHDQLIAAVEAGQRIIEVR